MAQRTDPLFFKKKLAGSTRTQSFIDTHPRCTFSCTVRAKRAVYTPRAGRNVAAPHCRDAGEAAPPRRRAMGDSLTTVVRYMRPELQMANTPDGGMPANAPTIG